MAAIVWDLRAIFPFRNLKKNLATAAISQLSVHSHLLFLSILHTEEKVTCVLNSIAGHLVKTKNQGLGPSEIPMPAL